MQITTWNSLSKESPPFGRARELSRNLEQTYTRQALSLSARLNSRKEKKEKSRGGGEQGEKRGEFLVAFHIDR